MPRGRILCVTSNFPRWHGDSTTPFVLHLNQDLQQLGWQITVLAPHAPGAKTHEVLDGITVRRFRYLWPEALETICYQGGALINLRKHRSNYLKLPALILCEWLQTLCWLKKEPFDLLHSHWLLPQGFVGVLSAGLLDIPHVCTVHGGDAFGLQSPFLKKFKAFTIRHCDAVTVNSSATRQAVTSRCPDYPSLHTIPMGVDVPAADSLDDSFTSGLRLRFRRGENPLLLFTGRLVAEKGLADLIDAMVLLREQWPEMTLLVIGEGQDRPIFERQASTCGMKHAVIFLGWVEPHQVRSYMTAADLLVAPSRNYEAQGLAVIEAMMAGRPVVASRIGGFVDSVHHGETGLLVDERSPAQLAAAIAYLLNDPTLACSMGRKGQEMAASMFSRQASAAKFSRLFESLCQKEPVRQFCKNAR